MGLDSAVLLKPLLNKNGDRRGMHPNSRRRNKELDSHLDEIQELYLKGLSCERISNKFGCTPGPILRRVRELDIVRNLDITFISEIESEIDQFTLREKQIILAAWIDTEGWVTLYKRHKSGYRASIGVCNTKEKAIDILHDWFGGLKVIDKPYHKNASPAYRLLFSEENCRRILSQILPFLILKRRHAELLYEALALHQYNRRLNHSGSDLIAKNRTRLDEIYNELKILNARGKNNGH